MVLARRDNRVKKKIVKDTGEAAINAIKSLIMMVATVGHTLPKRSGHPTERLGMEPEDSSPVSQATLSGADSYSATDSTVATGVSASTSDEPRMSTSEEVAIIAERSTVTEPESLATTVVDETLRIVDELSSPRRTNPFTAILARVDSADALKHEGSMLYRNERGHWVVVKLPEAEGISMHVATSTTQIVNPTLTVM